MNPIQVGAPHQDARSSGDEEKNTAIPQTVASGVQADGDSNFESDGEYQEGVERVRAITAVWTKKTLLSMFLMYVGSLPLPLDTLSNSILKVVPDLLRRHDHELCRFRP